MVAQQLPVGPFKGCSIAGRLENSAGVDNEEVGADVWICSGPAGGWSAAWDDLAHYDA